MPIQVKIAAYLVSIVLFCSMIFGVFMYGRHVEKEDEAAQQLVTQQKAVVTGNAVNKQDAVVAQAHEQVRTIVEYKDRVVAAKIEKAAAAPSYSCALTPADLELLNQSIKGE